MQQDDDNIRKRIKTIDQTLQSRESNQELPPEALAHIEVLLGLAPQNPDNRQSTNDSGLMSPSPSTTFSANNHTSPGRPILFTEAHDKRWSAQSAVGKAATGVRSIVSSD